MAASVTASEAVGPEEAIPMMIASVRLIAFCFSPG